MRLALDISIVAKRILCAAVHRNDLCLASNLSQELASHGKQGV